MEIKLFTIGFTQKSAREFFTNLKDAGVKRVVDVRLNNNSQLAGFSKKEDLAYFLKEVAGIDYVHLPELAPTQAILDAYKKHKGDWNIYERQFLDLRRGDKSKRRFSRNGFSKVACFAVNICRINAIGDSWPNTSMRNGVAS